MSEPESFIENVSEGWIEKNTDKPELSIGLPAGNADSGSLISTTTQSDIKNVLATAEAYSKQHITTFKNIRLEHNKHDISICNKIRIFTHFGWINDYC